MGITTAMILHVQLVDTVGIGDENNTVALSW